MTILFKTIITLIFIKDLIRDVIPDIRCAEKIGGKLFKIVVFISYLILIAHLWVKF